MLGCLLDDVSEVKGTNSAGFDRARSLAGFLRRFPGMRGGEARDGNVLQG